MNRIKSYILAHKIISSVIVIALVGGGYWGYKKFTSTSGDTRYVTAKVTRGTIVASVSGSGQVSALSQIDIKSKVSGDVIALPAQAGNKVSTGSLIAELDASDASKAVRDGETSLQSAKLSLEKLKIQNSNQNLTADQKKAYDDGFGIVSDTFLDLTPTLNGMKDILDQANLSDNAAQVVGRFAVAEQQKSSSTYESANTAFKKNTTDFAAVNNNSPIAEIANIISETYETTRLLSDSIKSAISFVDDMAKNSSNAASFTAAQTTLSGYTTTINGHLSDLLTAETNIENNKDTFQNADLDIQSAELSVTQKENALTDAQEKLADYFIRAPFSGTISNVAIKKSDSVGSGTTVATLITDAQVAEISLNEVDVAKIKVGEKATLTFDALPELTISGSVQEIDSVGTVSQGVVTYDVKISFDTKDNQVKPGMSVTAAIITDIKQDVLVVPNSAVKSQGGESGTSYVESFDAPLPAPSDGLIGSISKNIPNKIPIEVGLSNDSQTEVASGLKEGDEIITRTILPTSGNTTAAAPSLFGGGNRGAAGGGARIPAPGR